MTFAYWCVLLTAFLPIVWVGAAKAGGHAYDNARPRVFLENLSGWQQRANWAQQNAYENFPPFAAGVIIAHMIGADQTTIDMLAGVFLLARTGHGLAYIYDKPTVRSLIWTAGFFAMVGLYLAAAWTT